MTTLLLDRPGVHVHVRVSVRSEIVVMTSEHRPILHIPVPSETATSDVTATHTQASNAIRILYRS